MANKPFKYQAMFPHAKADTTEYYHLTSDYVKVENWNGHEMLVVDPEALTVLARQATHDNAFMLRREHNAMVAKILNDPEASENDKFVALTMLRNAEVAAKGQLPFCQDTGTAIIHGSKGQNVFTGGGDEERLSKGVYLTYTEDNLRYSQNAPLNMYDEVNTGCNLPAQIDLHACDGNEYNFLFVAKGGGSANKTYLYQETKALINPKTLIPFLVEKMKSLGTAACPPYHIAFVIGGTSAEMNLATVKKASVKYYDDLPTEGNELGHAFRDIELEKQLLEETHKIADNTTSLIYRRCQIIVYDLTIIIFGKRDFILGFSYSFIDNFRCIGSSTFKAMTQFLYAWRHNEYAQRIITIKTLYIDTAFYIDIKHYIMTGITNALHFTFQCTIETTLIHLFIFHKSIFSYSFAKFIVGKEIIIYAMCLT